MRTPSPDQDPAATFLSQFAAIIFGGRSRRCPRRRRTAAGRTSRSTRAPRSRPRRAASASARARPTRASSSTRPAGPRTESVSVCAARSQSARSSMPGSRSIQRPCVSSMSSRDGVKTSKTRRPPGRSSSRAARERLEPLVVVAQVEIGAERTRHERDALVDRRPAQVAEPQVEPLRDAGLPRPLGADREHPGGRVDADHVRAGQRGRNGDPPGARRRARRPRRPRPAPRRRRTRRPRRRSRSTGRRAARSGRRRSGLPRDVDELERLVRERLARRSRRTAPRPRARRRRSARPTRTSSPTRCGSSRASSRADVDPVVRRDVAERVHDAALVLRLPVEPRRDRVAEDEGVEGEPPAGPQRGGDALEDPPLLLPAVQVEERAERDVDQRRGLVELELADVAEPQLERQARRHARGRSRASPATSRCRARACRSRARPRSRRGRSRPSARRSARPPRARARRSARRPRSCRPPTRRRRAPRRRIRSSRVVSTSMSASRVFAFTQPRLVAGASAR